MSYGVVSSNDDWQAKDDARILAVAKKAAISLAEDKVDESEAMKAVSSGAQVKEKTGILLLTNASTSPLKKYDGNVSSFLKGT